MSTNANIEIPLCINCRYQNNSTDHFCMKEKVKKWSPVVGFKLETIIRLCEYTRLDELKCGLEGKWFEPKEIINK